MAERFVVKGVGGSLYDQFHSGVAGTRPVYDAASTFNQISQAHQQDQDDLRNALSGIKVSYTGSAADNMQDAFRPLLSAMGVGSQRATDAAQSLQNQGDHFAVAQANIQQSVSVPAEPWYENFDPANTAYDNALQRNSNIDSANQAVYKAYGNNTTSNNAPGFQPILGAGIFGESDGLGPLLVTSGPQLAPGVPSVPGVGVGPRGSVTTSTTQQATRTPQRSAAPPNPNGQTSSPQGAGPAPTGSTGPTGSGTATQGYSGPPPLSATASSGVGWTGAPAAGSQSGSATPTGTDPMLGVAVGGGVGAGGSGSPVGRPGGGFSGAGGEGPSGRPAGLGGVGNGARSGAGAEAELAPGEVSSAGAARATATEPGALAGGRSGRREEDREHKAAAYLVNEDNGNEIVGDLDRTVPPVIGL